jgi:Fe-S-cluster containining protein
MGVQDEAGEFSPWLAQMQRAIASNSGSDVPCGSCTACCTSSKFIQIGPDEVDALAHIPPALLFPAPQLPTGHMVMGYDQRGHCPMLRNGQCSIYQHRPRTCRTYDCRVFPAAGLKPEDKLIAQRTEEWRFSFSDETDQAAAAAVRAAAAYLTEHWGEVAPERAQPQVTQLAVLAVELHGLFLSGRPETAAVRAALLSRRTSP